MSRNPQSGIILITSALMMVALLGMAALAIDAAHVMEVRSQLQNSADATALAGVSGLVVVSQQEQGGNINEARRRADHFSDQNPVLDQSFDLDPNDSNELEFGLWDYDLRQFFTTTTAPNSVRVNMRLTPGSTPLNPTLFFAPVLGQRTAQVAATATAALGARNIMLVLDRSGSMADDGNNPQQPLTDVKRAAIDNFVTLIGQFPIEGDRMGLVWYNDQATLTTQLTNQFSDVEGGILPGPNAAGCTNIAAALCKARKELLSDRLTPRGVNVVVLLTDGKTNTRINPLTCARSGAACVDTSRERDPTNLSSRQAVQEAQRLKDETGAIIYTINFGNDTNPGTMEEIANIGDGKNFVAANTQDLAVVFQEISASIPIQLVE